ncbi:hypothetical protein [Paenibacillus sp. PL91]|uniref:hypothetical protein n=1 Tax=Paenibacillus sp. PL91 TaxID=2729538 RepID=UPI00145E1C5E|nr:hypothetical protein [Paenibacillus sp. PL91]MBC9198302.1 hypothetical protein [Paenibacillus sp. PL91]
MLIFVALLIILKDHTGTSLGDRMLNTFGLSSWTNIDHTGFYLPGIIGITLFFVAVILTRRAYRSKGKEFRNQMIIGCILLIWLFPFASEKSLFLLLYHTSSVEKIDYSIKNNKCTFNGKENDVIASCSVTVYNYGKAESVSIRPLINEPPAEVVFDAKVISISPHRAVKLNADFVGTQKNGSGLSGYSEEMEFELTTPAPENATYDAVKMREIAWHSLLKEEKVTVINDWYSAEVTPSKWESIPSNRDGKTKNENQIVRVIFKTDQDPFLGPIGIYIDAQTEAIVGYNFRH